MPRSAAARVLVGQLEPVLRVVGVAPPRAERQRDARRTRRRGDRDLRRARALVERRRPDVARELEAEELLGEARELRREVRQDAELLGDLARVVLGLAVDDDFQVRGRAEDLG